MSDTETAFSDADLDRILDGLESEAATAIDQGVKREARPDTLGNKLHPPLKPGQPFTEQRFHHKGTQLDSSRVFTPHGGLEDSLRQQLQERRPEHKALARRLAKRLEGIRDQTLQRLRFQDQGKLDRRRMIAAVKGSKDVRVQYQEQPATSFAASIALDMSGSMKDHIAAGRLFDSTMVLSDTFEQLEIPYEIRGFGTGEAQYKTMDDPQADLERTGHLVGRSLGGTHMANTAGLATTSLMARPEKNRLFVSLTDGALSDHDDAMAQMHYARKQGIVTYGVFLGPNPDQTKMDEIYGPGNWTAINELSDLPDVVGKRLGVLFNKIR